MFRGVSKKGLASWGWPWVDFFTGQRGKEHAVVNQGQGLRGWAHRSGRIWWSGRRSECQARR